MSMHSIPSLVHDDDVPTIGNRHGSAAQSTHATQMNSNDACLHERQSFILEICSGTGRLSATIRINGIVALEFDLIEQGRFKNILDKGVFQEVKDLINHRNCVGAWFAFPCGTFSSARRPGAGPPPRRSTR